jgi:uncharacterized protein YndB with AHSA1/START domain
MSKTTFTIGEDKKTLIVERTFDAPKAKVWAAHSDPKILARWWGPKGWETTIKHMEFKEGGYWHYGMKCMDQAQGDWYGKTSWGKGVYGKISPQDSFEFTDIFCDENAVPIPDMPVSKSRVTLVEKDGRTTLVSRTEYATAEALAQVLQMGMQEGYTQTLDNLESVLAQ